MNICCNHCKPFRFIDEILNFRGNEKFIILQLQPDPEELRGILTGYWAEYAICQTGLIFKFPNGLNMQWANMDRKL